MDGNRQVVLDKGVYTRSINSELIKLKQYVIAMDGDKRCLLLRFTNESEIVITGFDVVITQIKANGKEGKSIETRLENFEIQPGEMFSPKCGIVISDDCVDFKISIKCITSADYFYVETNGITRAKYVPLPIEESSDRSKGKVRYCVKRKKTVLYKFAAIVAVIGMAAFIAVSVYLSKRLLGNFDSLSVLLNSLR